MKVVNLDSKCAQIDSIIKKIIAKNLLKRGYMCGIINGMRIAKSIIESKEHEVILDRNEVQEISRDDIEIATNEQSGFSALVFKNGKLERLENL